MLQYKVNGVSVNGLGGKLFLNGDVVTEENFPPGNFQELVNKDFLRAVDAIKIPAIADISIADIKQQLDNKSIIYKPNASKIDLYKRLFDL